MSRIQLDHLFALPRPGGPTAHGPADSPGSFDEHLHPTRHDSPPQVAPSQPPGQYSSSEARPPEVERSHANRQADEHEDRREDEVPAAANESGPATIVPVANTQAQSSTPVPASDSAPALATPNGETPSDISEAATADQERPSRLGKPPRGKARARGAGTPADGNAQAESERAGNAQPGTTPKANSESAPQESQVAGRPVVDTIEPVAGEAPVDNSAGKAAQAVAEQQLEIDNAAGAAPAAGVANAADPVAGPHTPQANGENGATADAIPSFTPTDAATLAENSAFPNGQREAQADRAAASRARRTAQAAKSETPDSARPAATAVAPELANLQPRNEQGEGEDTEAPRQGRPRPNDLRTVEQAPTNLAGAAQLPLADGAPSGTATNNETPAATTANPNTAAAVSAAGSEQRAPDAANSDARSLVAPNLVQRLATPGAAWRSERPAAGPRITDVEQVRLVNRVARAFEAAQHRGGELQLRLSPPELGSLRLEVRLQGGALSARIEAENPVARSLLLENLPALRERLAEYNIRIEHFEVDSFDSRPQHGGPQGGNEERSAPSRPWQRAAPAAVEKRPLDEVGPPSLPGGESNLINVVV